MKAEFVAYIKDFNSKMLASSDVEAQLTIRGVIPIDQNINILGLQHCEGNKSQELKVIIEWGEQCV